ncbi:MAG: 2-oxo-4-hydroxy-4-carboxy-5-ureidoimidazoline decarboxylase [Fimbriimonadaceae bacterium]|nr:2-oxo-4-hydroxy-4-carboxy-5-ureidoimidazoline decarboxylase [Alphaproteobacteria bacterium]
MTGVKIQPSTMSRAAFGAAFGPVYEHSPWIAERAYDLGLSHGHDEPDALAAVMAQILDGGSEQDKLDLLRAHPDLAGKLALRGGLTEASATEQSGAQLDQCSEEEFARFTLLNNRYKEKFGFPFILAVRDHDRTSILRLFEQRTGHTKSEEFSEALRQVNRIAALRIANIFLAEEHK